MTKMTIEVPDELLEKMNKAKGTNWTKVACHAFRDKLSEIEISQITDVEALRKNVTDWIHKQGFPLEMRIARATRQHFGPPVQATYPTTAYVDGKKRTWRDADVVNLKWAVDDKRRVYCFAVIECKSGKQPWIVFTLDHEDVVDAGINVIQQLTTIKKDRPLLEKIVTKRRDSLQSLLEAHGTLLAPRYTGYNVQEFKKPPKNGHSPPWNAIRQVISASQGITRENKRFWNNQNDRPVTLMVATNFIVTNAPLFSCRLSDTSEEIVEPVDKVMYVDFRGQGQAQRMHYVRILSEKAFIDMLPDLARDLESVANQFLQGLVENENSMPHG